MCGSASWVSTISLMRFCVRPNRLVVERAVHPEIVVFAVDQPVFAEAADSLRGLDIDRERRVGTFVNRQVVRLQPLKAAQPRFAVSPAQQAAMPIGIGREDQVRKRNYRVAVDVKGAVGGVARMAHVHRHLVRVNRPRGRALLASAGRKEALLYNVVRSLLLYDLLALEMVDILLRQHLGVVEHHRLVGDVDGRLGRPHFDLGIDQMNVPNGARLAVAAHDVDLVGLQHAAALGHDGVALDYEGVGLGVVDRFLAGDVYGSLMLSADRGRNCQTLSIFWAGQAGRAAWPRRRLPAIVARPTLSRS